MEERLKVIETRCKALGWDAIVFDLIVRHMAEMISGHTHINTDKEYIQAAERILSLYEDGPAVRIGGIDGTCLLCELHGACCIMGWESVGDEQKPGSYCPGTGTFKLIPVEVDNE